MADRFDKGRLCSIDILEVARKLDFPAGTENGKDQMAHCFLHKDKNPSLMLWTRTYTWKCFACGKKRDVILLVMEHEAGVSPHTLKDIRDGKTSIKLDSCFTLLEYLVRGQH